MTEKAKLIKKIIEKAKVYPYQFYGFDEDGRVLFFPEEDGVMIKLSFSDLTFDHSFCKAFWPGEIMYCGDCLTVIKDWFDKCETEDCPRGSLHKQEAWAYHIQQLALAEDRLKYLSEYI